MEITLDTILGILGLFIGGGGGAFFRNQGDGIRGTEILIPSISKPKQP